MGLETLNKKMQYTRTRATQNDLPTVLVSSVGFSDGSIVSVGFSDGSMLSVGFSDGSSLPVGFSDGSTLFVG